MASMWENTKDCMNLFFSSKFFKRHLELYKTIIIALYLWVYDIYTASPQITLLYLILFCYKVDEML